MIAVGPRGRDDDGKLIPLDVKAGDRILFGKWSGTEVKIDGDVWWATSGRGNERDHHEI